MRLPKVPTARVLTLSGILLLFLFGTFGISRAHDPAENLASLQIVQLSRSVLLAQAQQERYSLGPALVAEPTGAQNSLDGGPRRLDYSSIEPNRHAASLETASLRTRKVSLHIINSALQI